MAWLDIPRLGYAFFNTCNKSMSDHLMSLLFVHLAQYGTVRYTKIRIPLSSIPAIRVCQTIWWVCCLCILHCMAQLDIPRLGDTPSSIPAIRVCQTISWVCCLCILHSMAQLDIPRLGDTPSSIPAIRVCQTISWVCCLCILRCMAGLDIPRLGYPFFNTCNKSMSDHLMSLLFVHLALYGTVRYTKIRIPLLQYLQ